jgi:hypothetical protein
LEQVFVDQSDYVWIVEEEENPRVQKFDTDGNFITRVGSRPYVIEEEVKEDGRTLSLAIESSISRNTHLLAPKEICI